MKKIIFLLLFAPLSIWGQRDECNSIDSSKVIYTYFVSYNYYGAKNGISNFSGSGNAFLSTNKRVVDRGVLNCVSERIIKQSERYEYPYTDVVVMNFILTEMVEPKKKKQ